MTNKRYDLTGLTFDRLTVVKLHGKSAARNLIWECKCKCGNTCNITGKSLRSKGKKSCGCINRELLIVRNKNNATHGMSGTKAYNTWARMKQRCEDINYHGYKDYGGRGISVYDKWSKDFTEFYKYMGDPPSKKYSIDRIDNDSNYEPGNVKWSTSTEQCNNRRGNVFITNNGKTMTIGEWTKEKSLNYNTLYARLQKKNWNIERSLNDKV